VRALFRGCTPTRLAAPACVSHAAARHHRAPARLTTNRRLRVPVYSRRIYGTRIDRCVPPPSHTREPLCSVSRCVPVVAPSDHLDVSVSSGLRPPRCSSTVIGTGPLWHLAHARYYLHLLYWVVSTCRHPTGDSRTDGYCLAAVEVLEGAEILAAAVAAAVAAAAALAPPRRPLPQCPLLLWRQRHPFGQSWRSPTRQSRLASYPTARPHPRPRRRGDRPLVLSRWRGQRGGASSGREWRSPRRGGLAGGRRGEGVWGGEGLQE